jgi:hypothetical protein
MSVQRCSRIAFLLDRPRLSLCFPVRLSEIDVRNPLMPAVIGGREQHGCSTEHAPAREFYFSSALSF